MDCLLKFIERLSSQSDDMGEPCQNDLDYILGSLIARLALMPYGKSGCISSGKDFGQITLIDLFCSMRRYHYHTELALGLKQDEKVFSTEVLFNLVVTPVLQNFERSVFPGQGTLMNRFLGTGKWSREPMYVSLLFMLSPDAQKTESFINFCEDMRRYYDVLSDFRAKQKRLSFDAEGLSKEFKNLMDLQYVVGEKYLAFWKQDILDVFVNPELIMNTVAHNDKINHQYMGYPTNLIAETLEKL